MKKRYYAYPALSDRGPGRQSDRGGRYVYDYYKIFDDHTGKWMVGSKQYRHEKQATAAADRLNEKEARKNPARGLPVGRYIKVKAIRRKNGRVDLYRA
jgi:hypothetical protein